jgi:hypothetical protein
MWKRLHVKYPLFLSDFIETWIFVTDFWKASKCQSSWKSVQWESSCSVRTDRWTDGHDEPKSRFPRQTKEIQKLMRQKSYVMNVWKTQQKKLSRHTNSQSSDYKSANLTSRPRRSVGYNRDMTVVSQEQRKRLSRFCLQFLSVGWYYLVILLRQKFLIVTKFEMDRRRLDCALLLVGESICKCTWLSTEAVIYNGK